MDPLILRDEVKDRMNKLNIDASIQVSAMRMMMNPSEQPRMTKLAPIYDALFPEITDAVRKAYFESHEPSEWTNSAERAIEDMGVPDLQDTLRRDLIQCAMTYYLISVVGKVEELQRWSEMGGLR